MDTQGTFTPADEPEDTHEGDGEGTLWDAMASALIYG